MKARPMFDLSFRRGLVASAGALLMLNAPALAQQQPVEEPQAREVPEGLAAVLYLGTDDVRAVQYALQQAGHDPGAPDGLWGEQSRAAMRQFQQAQGLDVSGNIDLASLRALQLWETIMSPGGAPASPPITDPVASAAPIETTPPDETPPQNGASPLPDAAAPPPGGAAPDAAPTPDAGAPPDGAPAPDGPEPADGTPPQDATQPGSPPPN